MRVLELLLRPLVLLIHQITTWASQNNAMRNDDSNGLTDEALRLLMSTTDGSEEIEENEREMIVSILELNDTVAPRSDGATD